MEVYPGAEGLSRVTVEEMVVLFRQDRCSWAELIAGSASDRFLRRYFSTRVARLTEIGEQNLAVPQIQAGLAELLQLQAGHLLLYYGHYIRQDVKLPPGYAPRTNSALARALHQTPLEAILLPCLEKLSSAPQLTFGEYRYAALLEEAILLCTAEQLVTELFRINFNHLGFYNWWVMVLRKKLDGRSPAEKLEVIRQELDGLTAAPMISFDPNWPSLQTMIKGWLIEEKAEVSQQIRAVQKAKLPLNLSAAHLSCLLRLFYEENLLVTQNLSVVFKFFASHYTTRRQQALSPGSLSKEFYGVSQVTAATVRGYLQKMISRINREYFPVWIATGVLIRFVAGT